MGLFALPPPQQQQQQRAQANSQQEQQQQVAIDPAWHVALSDVEEEIMADLPVLEAAEAAAAAAAGRSGGDSMLVPAAAAGQPGVESLLAPGGGGAGGLSVSDEVLADLPVLEAAEAAPAVAAAEAGAAAGPAVVAAAEDDVDEVIIPPDPGATQFAAVAATAAAAADAADADDDYDDNGGRGTKRGRTQQQQQENSAAAETHWELKLHRKLTSNPVKQLTNSSSSSSSSSNGHHHGPDIEGCSFKGQSLLPSQDWLQPPKGWSPPFAVGDRDRGWRSGQVAPLGANMVLLLYGKVRDSSSSSSSSSSGMAGDFGDVLVRLIYNEQVVRIPGCESVDPDGFDCTLQDFLDYVVGDKTATDRFKRYCYGSGAVGTVITSGSSRSSEKRSRVSAGRGGGRLSLSDSAAVASVATADGLQLLLGTRQQQQLLWAEE
jgi:hypothetical protein